MVLGTDPPPPPSPIQELESLPASLFRDNSEPNAFKHLTSTFSPTHPADVVPVTGVPAHHLHEGLAEGGDGGEVLLAQLLVFRVPAGEYAPHALHI